MKRIGKNGKYFWSVFFLALIIIIFAVLYFMVKIKEIRPGEIDTTGESIVTTSPDTVQILVGVSITGDTAKISQSKVSASIANIVNALHNLGLNDSQIQTKQYSVSPQYDFTNQSVLTGYQTIQMLKITSQDINNAGSIIDASINAGANDLESVNFMLSDEKKNQIQIQALNEATDIAIQKADALSKSANVKLSKIKSISESVNLPGPLNSFEVPASIQTQVPVSNIEIDATVTVSYYV